MGLTFYKKELEFNKTTFFCIVSKELDNQLDFPPPQVLWNLVAQLYLLVPKQSLNVPKLSLA